MGRLMDAAQAWSALYDTQYELLLGRKGNWTELLKLEFLPEHFPHLAGIQYAADVDFGCSKAELRGKKWIGKILNGEIDDGLIEKSCRWTDTIAGRLDGILALEDTLDSEFTICRFDPAKVPHGTRIQAQYVIKNQATDMTFFVFLDQDTGKWFCRSVFRLHIADYTVNQTHVTVLIKRKLRQQSLIWEQINPHYRVAP